MSSWLSCVGTECLNCNLTDDPDEMDPFDSLRLYARVHLGAPDLDDGDDVPTGNVRNLTDDEFKSVFKHTIERRGWPVLKYGKGKALKRCLKVEGAGDDAHLSWGSKKEGAATKQVKVAEIHDVVNAAFDDAPPNMDPACMLCFNISNRAGLKIIAHSKTDATVLIHGFKLLTEPKNADIDQIRAKAIMV
ncbi:TATA-box binding protein [Aureococcus anophagefferens]